MMMYKISFILIFSVLIGTLVAQPSNDDCVNSIEFSNLDEGCINFNTTMASFDIANGDCVPGADHRNIWFTFLAQGPEINITSDGGPNDIYVTLIDFDPTICDFASLTQLACGSATGGNNALSYGALTIGNTYYIIANVGNNVEGPGTICLNNPDPKAAPIPTLGQWGLISLTLLMLIMGSVKVVQRKKYFG